MSADRSERAERCPDRGYCHGSSGAIGSTPCEPGACYRVKHAGPLSGVFPGDRWPVELTGEAEATKRPAMPPRIVPVEVIRDHEARLTAARRIAGYEIGDPAWADQIIAAYFNPSHHTIPEDAD